MSAASANSWPHGAERHGPVTAEEQLASGIPSPFRGFEDVRGCDGKPYSPERARPSQLDANTLLLYHSDAIRMGRHPYLDVYRGVAMSIVGILAWRSALNDSAPGGTGFPPGIGAEKIRPRRLVARSTTQEEGPAAVQYSGQHPAVERSGRTCPAGLEDRRLHRRVVGRSRAACRRPLPSARCGTGRDFLRLCDTPPSRCGMGPGRRGRLRHLRAAVASSPMREHRRGRLLLT